MTNEEWLVYAFDKSTKEPVKYVEIYYPEQIEKASSIVKTAMDRATIKYFSGKLTRAEYVASTNGLMMDHVRRIAQITHDYELAESGTPPGKALDVMYLLPYDRG